MLGERGTTHYRSLFIFNKKANNVFGVFVFMIVNVVHGYRSGFSTKRNPELYFNYNRFREEIRRHYQSAKKTITKMKTFIILAVLVTFVASAHTS